MSIPFGKTGPGGDFLGDYVAAPPGGDGDKLVIPGFAGWMTPNEIRRHENGMIEVVPDRRRWLYYDDIHIGWIIAMVGVTIWANL